MENLDSSNFATTGLTLDQQTIAYLEETRKWAFFLSIMGFIGIGILLLIGLFFSTIMGQLGGPVSTMMPVGILTTVYIVFALIYFFPVWYLFRFSVQMKTALHEMNQESLNASFGNMKSLFRFMGVITIIILSIYLLVFISAIAFNLFK